MMKHKWDLQLFAEGGGEGGAPAGQAEGGSAPAAPAVEEPALRPAEERQMRRSGQLKKQAAAPAAPPAEHPAEDTKAGKGEAAGEKAAGGDKAEAKPGGKAGEQADDAAFYEDMKKYPGQLERLVREVAAKTQAAQRQADARYEPLMKALAEKYGTTPDDLDGIMEALKGPVKDDAYYNALAMQMGTSVENARKMDELQTQNQRMQRAQQRQAQLAARQRQAAQVQQIQENWRRQDAEMQKKYPGFNFAEERKNPDFAAILRAGGSLESAYQAIHFGELMGRAQAATAQQVEQGVVNRIEQRGQRPAENGISPAAAGVAPVKDVRKLSARDCEELERRAARGERITF